MAKRREKNRSPSVPQFGEWNQTNRDRDDLNYSVVFSQVRANKKQHKHSLPHNSLGNEQDLLGKHQVDSPQKNSRTPVPPYRALDNPDNAMVSPKARAHKKHKQGYSLGNEKEIPAKQQQVSSMTRPKSVPQFGEWDQRGSPDYAKASPQARVHKQQDKHDVVRRSLGDDQDLGKHQEAPTTRPKSVPQIGEWDQRGSPDYAKASPHARVHKKQDKHDVVHRSMGDDQDLGKHQEAPTTRPKSVPQIGEWDQRGSPDYAKASPQARVHKKQDKHDVVRCSVGDDQALGKHQEAPTKNSPKPVPQFGAWDQKTGDDPTQAHAKKQHKRHSVGTEQELGKHRDALPMKNCPKPVPQFGAWDQKTGNDPTQARAKEKQHKHHSVGTEQELGKHRDALPMKTGWLSVPQFGDWEEKTVSETNYSVVFSQARANRRQHKSDLTHRSYDFEQELVCRERKKAAMRKKKKFLTFFSCCF